jgi:hypothetical protein
VKGEDWSGASGLGYEEIARWNLNEIIIIEENNEKKRG